MDTSDRLRKYEPDKIALLVFFALGLFVAFLISSSRYSGPAKAGTRLIRRIKYEGISSFLDTESRRTFFLIKSDPRRAIGFSMETYDDSNDTSEFEINSASLLYMPGRGGQEKLSYFRCDQKFDRFSWKSETVRAGGSMGVELSLDEGQNLSIRRLGLNGVERSYKLDIVVIPDYLLDLVFVEMAQSVYRKIIINILEHDGTITPALIQKQKIPHDGGGRNTLGAKDILTLELLDDRDYSQTVYIDGEGKIFRVILDQERRYILDRSSAEEVRGIFPERADFILRTEKTQ
jgi:hypothetical protein